ncbi:MobA/MobL family protein [Acinetobacter lwoffii]|uniref:MobQ family relaxase n=1 Tax=Acinetobacter lwoffii TaxID=28090 RepID=UPI00209A7D26|nr:MobQ family relaxase [Acinetobacter lwoffii]MCO8098277.1 MobA/MobL family protein [Acinetobacter lwoffii]
MAIYHFSVKTVARSAGRSATAAIAYRAGEKIYCEREGREHDYSRKTGVEYKEIYLPEGAPKHLKNREKLWNEVEQRETRKNSTVAREFEIAFPSELNQEQRLAMLEELCGSIVDRHQVAVDACIHAPHTGSGSDERNYHAHILMSTRKLTPEGFTDKTRELDQKHSGEIEHWREHFADICNMHLDLAGSTARVDHRSYKDQENGLEATLHEGPKVTELRRRGIETEISRTNDEIKERNQAQLQYGKNMDMLIAENEIKLSTLKTEQQTQIENSAKTPPIDEKSLFEQKQRETLVKLLQGEINAKETNLDLDFMQDVFKKAENTLGKMQKHKNEFSQQLAQDIVKSGLKQSHDKLQSLVDQHNELGQNKPLLFGKKAWEAQRDAIYQEHKQLKGRHEYQKKNGVKDLLENEKFKEHAWKQYQKQHPAKAEQYKNLYKNYQTIKTCVDEIKAEQQIKLRQEQQLKAKQQAPKMKSRGMSR